MTTPHRPRILGDLDENAPERWEWGGPSGPQIDLALLLYARDDAGLQRLEEEQTARLAAGGLALRHRLGTSDLDDFEPFGFRDGISQPFVEGLSKTGPPETDRPRRRVRARLPERVRPLHRPAAARRDRRPAERCCRATRRAPAAPTSAATAATSSSASCGRTCPGSGASSTTRPRRADGSSDPHARLRLAAKMVGRWPSGAPLALAPDADDPSARRRERLRLPRARPARRRAARSARTSAARIRATRSTRGPGSSDSLGDQPPPPHPAARPRVRHVADDRRRRSPAATTSERGLNFICLNANIQRQFEFVNHTWLNNPKFGRLYDDADPSPRRRRRSAARSRSRPTASASA